MARTRVRRSGRAPDYSWVGLERFAAFTQGSVQAFAGSSNLGTTLAGTIMRVRGHVGVGMDVGAADDAGVVGVGLIVGTDAAVAVGSTAFPSPLDQFEADWMWHGLFAFRSISATQGVDVGGQYLQREIDSKAMRKFKSNENLVVMVDGSLQAGTPTFDIIGSLRILIAS